MKLQIYPLLIMAVMLAGNMNNAHAQECRYEIIRWQETFGTGNAAAKLVAGRTNYYYNSGTLNDGDYKLSNSSQGRPEWHNSPDHTGNINGRMMITNASYTPGEFYRDTVTELIANATYNVYLFVMNVNTVGTCSPNPILPRLQFVVESFNHDGSFTPLTAINTEDIPQTQAPTWLKVGGFFNLPVGTTAIRYRIINNATGGCGNDLAIDDITFSQCEVQSLPVVGMELQAKQNGSAVELKWSTQQEINTDKFILQKSTDGKIWNSTYSVNAAGTSSTTLYYTTKDYNPYNPETYYRLIQMDKDGKFTHSNTARIKINSMTTTTTIMAHPNPFLSVITLEVSVPEDKHGIVRLFDINGRIVKMISWNLKRGLNVTRLNNLEQLHDGVYILDVVDPAGQVLHKTKVVKG